MANKKSNGNRGGATHPAPPAAGPPPARSVPIASRGIRTDEDAANFLSALVTDVMSGAVEDRTARTAGATLDRLFRVVTLRHRYGKPSHEGSAPLKLADVPVIREKLGG